MTALVVAGAPVPSALAETPAAGGPAPTSRPGNPYGVAAHVSRDEEHRLALREFELIRRAGIDSIRTDFDWFRVEPKQGDWRFRELDDTVDWAEKSGQKLLAIIGSNTSWANPAFQHGEEWSRFVGQLVERYKGRVKHWEVWNEPNLARFWPSPSPADYTILLKQTYRTIKDADPTATVVLGGLSGIPRDFIEGIYRNGGRDSFDVMNVHPYCYPGSPEKKRLYEDLVALRVLMARHGDGDKPVWITEMGWPTHQSPAYLFETVRAGLSVLRPKQTQWTMAVLDDPDLPTDEPNDSAIEQMAPGKATLRHVTCAEIRDLNPADWTVLVLPPEESFPSGSFDAIEGYVRRGGIVVFWYGVPLYFELKRGADGQWNRAFAGESYRRRLHIGWAAYWTAKDVPKEVRPLVPAEGLAERIHPPKDAVGVRFVTDAALKDGDRMIPLLTGQSGEFRGVVAAAYSFNSDLKGGVVVSTVMNAATDVSPERQGQILPRACLLAFQAGVERVFWYELQAYETDPYYREAHFGIVQRDLTPKPAYLAYATLIRARPAGSQTLPGPWQSNGLYYPRWRRPDGELAWALWAPGPDRPCTLEIEGRVKEAFDHLGRPVDLKSSGTLATVRLGESVLYVVGPGNVQVRP